MKEAIGVLIGWVLGLFSSQLANDASAIVHCRRTLFELKELLEALARNAGTGGCQSEEQIQERLEQIKRVVQKLSVDHSALLFHSPLLEEKLEATLPQFYKYQLKDQHAGYKPHAIAAHLNTIIWGIIYAPPYESTVIPEIQTFLNLSQSARCWVYIQFKVRKLLAVRRGFSSPCEDKK
jgi:hypothetical protein